MNRFRQTACAWTWRLVTPALVLVAISSTGAFSAERRVPGEFGTIQAALDAAVGGDVILVSPGTYVENLRFGGKAVTLLGEEGRDRTILDAGGRVGVEMGPGAVLTGFTIRNASGSFGGLLQDPAPVDSRPGGHVRRSLNTG